MPEDTFSHGAAHLLFVKSIYFFVSKAESIWISKVTSGVVSQIMKFILRVWSKSHDNNQTFITTIEPQWLEHLWDQGNLFEIWLVRATRVNHGARMQMAII